MSGGRFERCAAFVFGVEKGYSDRKADRGGPTNLGITWRTLAAAKRADIVPAAVRLEELTREQGERIYFELYWKAARCPELPAPLDLLTFDAWVNHRPGDAAELLQVAVGAVVDGVIGPATIRCAQTVELVGAVERYARAREQLFRTIVAEDKTGLQQQNLHGWLNRLASLKAAALEELAA